MLYIRVRFKTSTYQNNYNDKYLSYTGFWAKSATIWKELHTWKTLFFQKFGLNNFSLTAPLRACINLIMQIIS